MTLKEELSDIVDKLIMHRVDVIISDDNEWFDELIDNKIKERIKENIHINNKLSKYYGTN